MPTLDATVSGAAANSYQDRAAAAVILDNLSGFTAFAAASTADQDRALISAAQDLDTLIAWDLGMVGYEPASLAQMRFFPRIGTLDQHGNELASTAIPWFVLQAHAMQADARCKADRTADTARGVRRVKAGAVEVELDPVDAGARRVAADAVRDLLAPWLAPSRRRGDFLTAAIARA